MTETAHFDESWKEALDTYFPEVIVCFFADLYALIDWQRPIEFLDTQFQQLIPTS